MRSWVLSKARQLREWGRRKTLVAWFAIKGVTDNHAVAWFTFKAPLIFYSWIPSPNSALTRDFNSPLDASVFAVVRC